MKDRILDKLKYIEDFGKLLKKPTEEGRYNIELFKKMEVKLDKIIEIMIDIYSDILLSKEK